MSKTIDFGQKWDNISMVNIFSQIRMENDQFFNQWIAPVPGYSFNQYETIKRCHLYRNSKYEDGTPYLNREKLFFNVVNPACEVASKMLNVDTKNIRLLAENPKSHFATFLLEKELKQWLKTSKLSRVLNQIAEETPVYGSVVLHKTKDGAEVVDIRRLICDQSVESIQKSRFITTIHYMTPSELRETGWEDVDVAIERFGNTQAEEPFEDGRGDLNLQQSTPYIKVYKRYGEVPKWWIDGGKSEEMVKTVYIVAGADELELNDQGQPVGEKGVVLYKARWNKEYPYKDFHYTKTKGRWLGIGVIEMLFDVQERINELKNQKRVSMELSTLHLFQTKDNTIVKNVLTDLDNGALIKSPTGIAPIDNSERNLPAFKDEEASYIQQVEKLSFAYEAIRGELPSGTTPLGSTQIAVGQATSVYGFKKENLGIMLREFFNEFVMPQLLKDLNEEHIMRFVGTAQELGKLDQAVIELLTNTEVKRRLFAREPVEKEGIEMFKKLTLESIKKKYGGNRYLKIKKAFYSDVKYDFDFNIDNEQTNPQVIAQNLRMVLMDLATNPAMLQDPRIKLLYYKFADQLGINQAELERADEEAEGMQEQQMMQQMQQQGRPLAAMATTNEPES